MTDVINFGEIVAIGIALLVGYRSSFLWALFVYVFVLSFSISELFEVFRPDISNTGHTKFYFSIAMMITASLFVFSRYKFLSATILKIALCIQAITLFANAISGMDVHGFSIPQSEILIYCMNFVNANILMLEVIIAWIVASNRRKG